MVSVDNDGNHVSFFVWQWDLINVSWLSVWVGLPVGILGWSFLFVLTCFSSIAVYQSIGLLVNISY